MNLFERVMKLTKVKDPEEADRYLVDILKAPQALVFIESSNESILCPIGD